MEIPIQNIEYKQLDTIQGVFKIISSKFKLKISLPLPLPESTIGEGLWEGGCDWFSYDGSVVLGVLADHTLFYSVVYKISSFQHWRLKIAQVL